MTAGRKPIDRDLLRGYATQWACLLYGVRDGYPGFINPAGQPSVGKDASRVQRPARAPKRIVNLTASGIPIPERAVVTFRGGKKNRTTERFLLSVLKSPQCAFRYAYLPSVQPNCEIWNVLKAAKKVEHIEKVFEKLRRWALRIPATFVTTSTNRIPVVIAAPRSRAHARAAALENLQQEMASAWPLLPFLVSSDWAEKIIATKRLWTYPRSDRPTSDDKRIEFFARSLAAITLGRCPSTATARLLTDWHWPKDWYARPTLD